MLSSNLQKNMCGVYVGRPSSWGTSLHSSLTFDGMFLNHAKAILCVGSMDTRFVFFAFGYEVYIPMLTPTLCQMLTF